MLFGAEPSTLRRNHGLSARDAERAWSAWWTRYRRLAELRDHVHALVREAQAKRCALEIEAPSGRVSRFSAAEVAGAIAPHGAPKGPEGAWRSLWSAAFRAVEGDLMDTTVRHFAELPMGGKLVLPIYDGMILAAPAGAENAVEVALRRAAVTAAHDIGITVTETITTRATVDENGEGPTPGPRPRSGRRA
jgi:hypothetical protein